MRSPSANDDDGSAQPRSERAVSSPVRRMVALSIGVLAIALTGWYALAPHEGGSAESADRADPTDPAEPVASDERRPAVSSGPRSQYVDSATAMTFLDEVRTQTTARYASPAAALPAWEKDIFQGRRTVGEHLLRGRAILPDRVGEMFKSERFEPMMDTLRRYPGDAAMAQDYSALVRAALQQTLGRGNTARYACSDRICMVTVYSNQSPPLDVDAWFGAFRQASGRLATTFVHDSQTPRPGGYRIRMLIAVDPRAIDPRFLPGEPPTVPSR